MKRLAVLTNKASASLLPVAFGGAVGEREILDGDVVTTEDAEHWASRSAGIDAVPVGIGDDRLMTVLATEGDIVLGVQPDDFGIDAVANINHSVIGVGIGDKVRGALDRGEVAGAIGRNDQIGGVGRAGGFGGELPGGDVGNAGEVSARAIYEDAAVYSNVVGLVVVQDPGMRVDGGLIARDDNGIAVEGDAADGTRLDDVGAGEEGV